MVALNKKLGDSWQGQSVDYQYLLNPSHLEGVGDIAKAVEQKIFDNEKSLKINW